MRFDSTSNPVTHGLSLVWNSLLLPFVCAIGIAAFLVSPQGDFPLNDDWIFAQEVHALLSTGHYTPNPYSTPTVLAQTLWGAAFASLFGFNYTVLRISTMTLAGIAAWTTAHCARELGASRGVSVLAGLALFSNPIFLNLAYTFNTDVPFLAPLSASIYFYLRAAKNDRARDIFLGSALAVAAFFIRQFGLIATFAFALTYCLAYGPRRFIASPARAAALTGPWLAAGVAGAICYSGATHYAWDAGITNLDLYDRLVETLRSTTIFLVYLGLFGLPLGAARFFQVLMRLRTWDKLSWAGFAFCVVHLELILYDLPGGHSLPLMGNILRDLGTGPVTLRHTGFADPHWTTVHLGGGWVWVTALSVVSASVLLIESARWLASLFLSGEARWRFPSLEQARDRQTLFLVVCGGALAGALLLPFVPGRADRYLLPASVPVLALLAGFVNRTRAAWSGYAVAGLVGAATFAFSMVCVQDYMAWNTARWSAIHRLLDVDGVDPLRIDGGYEYQGVYTSAEYSARHHSRGFWDHGRNGWWILDDTYAVAFWPRDGYQVLAEAPYYSYLGRNDDQTEPTTWRRMPQRRILILKKLNSTTAGEGSAP